MSQLGLKALKVLGGAESPTDKTAQLSEAWLKKIQKINQVADNVESNNGVIKVKKTTPTPTKQQKQPVFEQRERQVPISEILSKTKTEKLGINKKSVSPDQIMDLLSGKKPQASPMVENKTIETQYDNFIKESKSYQKENNIIDDNETYQDNNIRQMVNEEVTKILFNEVFSKDRLKVMMESVFKDVIKEKAKEILFETLKRRKSQGL